jgi:hypothetical protein
LVDAQFAPHDVPPSTPASLSEKEQGTYYRICKDWVDPVDFKSIPLNRITKAGMLSYTPLSKSYRRPVSSTNFEATIFLYCFPYELGGEHMGLTLKYQFLFCFGGEV